MVDKEADQRRELLRLKQCVSHGSSLTKSVQQGNDLDQNIGVGVPHNKVDTKLGHQELENRAALATLRRLSICLHQVGAESGVILWAGKEVCLDPSLKEPEERKSDLWTARDCLFVNVIAIGCRC